MSKQTDLINVTDAITVSGSNVGIGTSSASEKLSILGNVNIGNNDAGNPLNYLRFGATQYGAADIRPSDEGAHKVGLDFYTDGTGDVTINPTFAMRLDSSGNLLVGKTAFSNTTVGISLESNGRFKAIRDSNSGYFGRLGSDGAIVNFAKDGTTVGSIGNVGTSPYFISGTRGIRITGNNIRPCSANGANLDNVIDLGDTGQRFDDIYATNGTIQTSDRNEKQDIEVLSDAETRVAQACKGLLRKFRWQDAVAEKGDDARVHFGIIAQDLQDAFAAEGLDAGRYAMFISSTWWEATETYTDDDGVEQTRTDTYETQAEAPEGATERTRLGVRYPELLAFIIGAM